MKLANYIPVKKELIEEIQLIKEQLFSEEKRIFGVFSKGTDYVQLKPCGHPVQPEASQLIAMVKDSLAQWNCSKIFLTTEEQVIVDRFKHEFPGLVITSKQKFVSQYSIQSGLSFKSK